MSCPCFENIKLALGPGGRHVTQNSPLVVFLFGGGGGWKMLWRMCLGVMSA